MEGSHILEELKARLDRIAPTAQSLWLIPSLAMFAMMALAAGLANIDVELPDLFDGLIYTGDPAAARDILSTTASAVAGVVTLTLTLTVVALQLVSSQFSPRILRSFLSDRTSKTVVALLLGTFSFALVTLFYVRSPDLEGDGGFVPAISISVLLGLAVVSLIGLVVFIHNLTQSLRIENVIDTITVSTLRTIENRVVTDDGVITELEVPGGAQAIVSKRFGYIVDYDVEKLIDGLHGSHLQMRVVQSIGEHLSEGAIAAWVWGASHLSEEELEEVRDVLNDSSTIGPNRSVTTDVAFGVRQLVDIAIRALSPGINDPTTATAAMARVATLLHRMLSLRFAEGRIHAGDGCAVQVGPVAFGDILAVAFTQPAIYGAGDPMVVRQLLRLLGDLGRVASSNADRQAVRDMVYLVAELGERQSVSETFVNEIRDLRFDVTRILDGDPVVPVLRTL